MNVQGSLCCGHSKDHHADLPQVIIGLAVTSRACRCWSGPGRAIPSTPRCLPRSVTGFATGTSVRVITIVDRSFSSNANLDYLRRGGGQWIAGERMRDGSADAAEALARPGRYTTVDDHLKVKEVLLESTPGVRWIVCWNTAEAAKDKARRDDAITRLEIELERIAAARSRAEQALKKATVKKTVKRLEAELAGHARAECGVREHRTLRRYLRQLDSGRLTIDRAAIAAEAKLDGKHLLSTSDQHLSAVEVAVSYKNLLEAERGFRDVKSTLLLRPVFHRLEHRIRAHVLICWLALLLIRVAEQRTEQTWNRIAHEMDRQAQAPSPRRPAPSRTPLSPHPHSPPSTRPATPPHHPASPPQTTPDRHKHPCQPPQSRKAHGALPQTPPKPGLTSPNATYPESTTAEPGCTRVD